MTINATKEHVMEKLRSLDSLDSEMEPYINTNWDRAIELSDYVLTRLPSIGFYSAQKRIIAFLVACEIYQKQINKGIVDYDLASLSMLILKLTNKSFLKAITMFEIKIKQGRLRLRDIEAYGCDADGGKFAIFLGPHYQAAVTSLI